MAPDRRMLYNRASADPDGKPWSERKAYVWWDEESGRWTGHDVPDFEVDKAPWYRPPDGASGAEGLAGDDPFIMQGDGKGSLFVPQGLVDGPIPTHYEAAESVFRNPLYAQQGNPTRKEYEHPQNRMNPSPPEQHSEVYPFVFTVSRLTEHHTAGAMSRNLEYLSELQPEMFVEVSPELAAERGLEHMGWCHVVTSRSAVEGRVMVTDRLLPLRIEGRVLHQVWMPYHFGASGLVTGDSANDLFGITLDPNVLIQESKAGTCDVPGRPPAHGPGAAGLHRRVPAPGRCGRRPPRADRHDRPRPGLPGPRRALTRYDARGPVRRARAGRVVPEWWPGQPATAASADGAVLRAAGRPGTGAPG